MLKVQLFSVDTFYSFTQNMEIWRELAEWFRCQTLNPGLRVQALHRVTAVIPQMTPVLVPVSRPIKLN